jgi:hypothetical protein
VLSGTVTRADVYTREGECGGAMTFATYDLAYYDESGERVLTERGTSIETSGSIEGEDR